MTRRTGPTIQWYLWPVYGALMVVLVIVFWPVVVRSLWFQDRWESGAGTAGRLGEAIQSMLVGWGILSVFAVVLMAWLHFAGVFG